MAVIGTVAAFLAVLVVLVLIHELGHFIAAKRAGITVQEFGVGFPPRIASVVWRGTRYSVNWIPLGGFVKMLGEDGELEAEKMRERGLSDAAIDKAMAGAFNRKPIWVRIVVLVAGVAMNFLLAGILFAVALSLPVPEGRGPLEVVAIQEDSPAASADLRVDDVIVAADGRSYEVSRELTEYVRSRAGEPVVLDVLRDGQEHQITVTPRDPDELRPGEGPIGFTYQPSRYVEVPSEVQGPVDALVSGFSEAGYLAYRIPGGLAEAVGGLLGLNPNAGQAVGPIGIAEETGRVLQAPLVSQLVFMGVLSVNLAVLNILPFPPLDGGRVMVVLIEALRRRRLPAEREALIYLTGFMVLIALVILISIQDVQRLIEG
ncbi:MAG TPA: M50 family metallopeptidase [Candidatus Limnocylindria bacterium]|nr:M50 family metallopeptidase [Candidatus Limnocylindria bacterium]